MRIDSLHELDDGRHEREKGRRVLFQVHAWDEIDEPASRQGNIVQYTSSGVSSVGHYGQSGEPFGEIA